jgi:hypothetical protein
MILEEIQACTGDFLSKGKAIEPKGIPPRRTWDSMVIPSRPGWPEVGKAYALWASMTGTTRKFQRSDFFRSLNIVWHTNHLRTARMDFWGAVALVCSIGIFAKLVQNLLTN